MTAAAHDDTGLDDLGPDALLDALADADRRERAAARDKLRVAYQWAVLHPATEETGLNPFTGRKLRTYEADEAVGGPGCPDVAAFSAEPLGVTLGVSTVTAIGLLADALDLHHRLPQIWAKVEALEVPAWKARQVARLTHALPAAGAAWVDEQIAPRLKRSGFRILDRIVAEAIATFDPARHAEKEAQAAESWDVQLYTPEASEFAGTSELTVKGDTPTLADLFKKVCAAAAAMGKAGDDRPLGVRKYAAFTALLTGAGVTGAGTTLFVHADYADLPDDTVGVGLAERLGPITTEQLKDWLGLGDVTIRPVIRTGETDWSVPRHDPPEAMREQVYLRDQTCRFPGCQVDARNCDLDHVVPYDPNGPPDQTRPSNLACLCRRHHRAKTAGVWRYTLAPDGTCHWTGPRGITATD